VVKKKQQCATKYTLTIGLEGVTAEPVWTGFWDSSITCWGGGLALSEAMIYLSLVFGAIMSGWWQLKKKLEAIQRLPLLLQDGDVLH